VRKLEPKDAAELCDIRASLSAMAGRLAARRIDDDGLALLKDIMERMEVVARESNIAAYYPLNIEFHAAILDMTGNERLTRMCADLDKELYLFRRRSLDADHGLQRSLEEHRRIVRAFEDRDPDAAAAALTRHALSGKERMLGSIEAGAVRS
jgi:DNA-binding GntR family transcriptional regulator